MKSTRQTDAVVGQTLLKYVHDRYDVVFSCLNRERDNGGERSTEVYSYKGVKLHSHVVVKAVTVSINMQNESIGLFEHVPLQVVDCVQRMNHVHQIITNGRLDTELTAHIDRIITAINQSHPSNINNSVDLQLPPVKQFPKSSHQQLSLSKRQPLSQRNLQLQQLHTSSVSDTIPSTQHRNTQTRTATSNNRNDAVTEQMLEELPPLFGDGIDNSEFDSATIISFLQRYSGYAESRSNDGTNLISKLFSVMTSRMRFIDVWKLVLGNTTGPRINEARQSAIEYLQTTVLHGRQITPEALEELVDKLYESLLQEASLNFNELRVESNINLANVRKSFFRHHALKLLHILFHDPNNVWFERFRQRLATMRNEYLAWSSHFLEGGDVETIDFILSRNPDIFRSTNPMIATRAEAYLPAPLTAAFAEIHASSPNISAHLVKPTPIVQRPGYAPPPPSTTQLLSIVNRRNQQHETPSNTFVSNTDRQSNLLDDWIPSDVRDVNSQCYAPPQPPFRDAYIEGMPAKRLCVHLCEDLPSSNLFQTPVLRSSSASSTNNQLSNQISSTSESVLAGEAAAPPLVNTSEQESVRLFEQFLRQDSDYSEVQNRMPNPKRYLDGDK